MTPEEQYDAAMKKLDVKVGDLVFVEREIESEFGGWGEVWSNYKDLGMDTYIGRYCKVACVDDNRLGIELESPSSVVNKEYNFPPYCMRKATPQEIKAYGKEQK